MFIFCRVQAIAIGQALVDGRWLDCVTHHDQLFRDEYALYRPLQVTTLDNRIINLNEHCSRPAQHKSSFDKSHVDID